MQSLLAASAMRFVLEKAVAQDDSFSRVQLVPMPGMDGNDILVRPQASYEEAGIKVTITGKEGKVWSE